VVGTEKGDHQMTNDVLDAAMRLAAKEQFLEDHGEANADNIDAYCFTETEFAALLQRCDRTDNEINTSIRTLRAMMLTPELEAQLSPVE
jgi:flagellar biosynthesis regulator FlaF